jgi:hypothetical protein
LLSSGQVVEIKEQALLLHEYNFAGCLPRPLGRIEGFSRSVRNAGSRAISIGPRLRILGQQPDWIFPRQFLIYRLLMLVRSAALAEPA